MNLTNELTARIADHLSNVRKNLVGLPADERQEILQSIESHIYDALESRSEGDPTPALLEAVIAEMDPPESYSQQFSGASVSQPESRRWWNRWWVQLASSVVIALLIHTFFVQSFRIATDAAVPELPRGSRVMVWKLPRSFAAGDLITYKYKGHVNVGRIMRIENGIPQVTRNGEPDVAVPHDLIIGKVFSVFWRAPNRILSVAEQSGTIPDGSDPTGRWLSVDFVSAREQFNPKTKRWNGDLYLKDLTFLPDGKTDRLFWTWRDGVLHHSGDNTDANFFIRKISGEIYLFLEWISGDVIQKGEPPKYYVLKKTS